MAKKSAMQLMKDWSGLFACDAVRVNGGWVEDSITGDGLKLFASPALAKKYISETHERFLKWRDKP